MKRTVVLALFIVAILCFLLPWISLSCMGTTITTASGVNMVTGKQYDAPDMTTGGSSTNSMDTEPLAVAALAVAVVGIVVSLMKFKQAAIVRVLLGIAGVVLLIALKFKFDNKVNNEGQGVVQVNYLIGYWLTIIVFGLAAAANFLKDNVKFSFQKTPNTESPAIEPVDKKPPTESPPPGPPQGPPPSPPQ
jgi:lysylphosphatidylglycerol synthetase-like protein (DUF2156 family)